MDFRVAVYTIAPTWLMGTGCLLVALANLWQARNGYHRKRWPKRIKAINWLVFGALYLWLFFYDPPLTTSVLYFRLAVLMVIFGEVSYHADTILDIIEAVAHKVKKRLYG